MTEGAISSLPPAVARQNVHIGDVHHAAYLMQGRLPQIRRALRVVREQFLAGDVQNAPTQDAWLNAVHWAMTGPPLEVPPGLFKRVLSDWIAQELFGLDDPTKLPEG